MANRQKRADEYSDNGALSVNISAVRRAIDANGRARLHWKDVCRAVEANTTVGEQGGKNWRAIVDEIYALHGHVPTLQERERAGKKKPIDGFAAMMLAVLRIDRQSDLGRQIINAEAAKMNIDGKADFEQLAGEKPSQGSKPMVAASVIAPDEDDDKSMEGRSEIPDASPHADVRGTVERQRRAVAIVGTYEQHRGIGQPVAENPYQLINRVSSLAERHRLREQLRAQRNANERS